MGETYLHVTFSFVCTYFVTILIMFRLFERTNVFQRSQCREQHVSSDRLAAVLNLVDQRFSNFFQVGTTFISQNVLRTTLLLNVLSIC
jgi:hypothetical protein